MAAPPGGGPPDLNKFDLPTADGYIALAAHPGQGMVLMSCLDAAVVDESDPLASDPALDMYDERNGFSDAAGRQPIREGLHRAIPRRARSRDARESTRSRAAISRRPAADAPPCAHQTSPHRAPTIATTLARRAMAPRYMIVYRTQAEPSYLDLSIDPSERAVGSIISPRPDLAELLGLRPRPDRHA